MVTRSYREYDTGPLKDMEFTGPPQLEWLPYKDKTVFQTVGVKTNGSRTFKQGIEFSLSTRRIRALATKLIVSGAYFKTRYENSEPQYVLTTVQLAEGTPYPYIGLYDQDDNTFHEVCNTNFLLDTQIPKLGLIFSTSFQCQWFSGMKAEWCNPAPTSYLDLQLQDSDLVTLLGTTDAGQRKKLYDAAYAVKLKYIGNVDHYRVLSIIFVSLCYIVIQDQSG